MEGKRLGQNTGAGEKNLIHKLQVKDKNICVSSEPTEFGFNFPVVGLKKTNNTKNRLNMQLLFLPSYKMFYYLCCHNKTW